jgi:hypothetical protein
LRNILVPRSLGSPSDITVIAVAATAALGSAQCLAQFSLGQALAVHYANRHALHPDMVTQVQAVVVKLEPLAVLGSSFSMH